MHLQSSGTSIAPATTYRTGLAPCDRCGSPEVVLGDIGTGEWLCVWCRVPKPARRLTFWQRLRAALGSR